MSKGETCAGCGYVLDGLPRSSGGMVHFPECGLEAIPRTPAAPRAREWLWTLLTVCIGLLPALPVFADMIGRKCGVRSRGDLAEDLVSFSPAAVVLLLLIVAVFAGLSPRRRGSLPPAVVVAIILVVGHVIAAFAWAFAMAYLHWTYGG